MFSGIYIYAAEMTDVWISIDYPREIKSNGTKSTIIEISNRGDTAFHDLELLVLNNDDLEIVLEKTRIDRLKPKETIYINMEIINKNKYYFSKDVFLTLKLSNDGDSNISRHKFTIKPVNNFWQIIIISISVVLIISFILLFIKTNKGELNA